MKNLTVEDARARMLDGVAPGPAETLPLDTTALGRYLAETLRASRDQPPFDASAMDGWAVRLADAADTAVLLRIAGESAAGAGYGQTLQPGEAVRIFTGAPVPHGADRVCIQEEATREGDHVRLGPLTGKSNIRGRGGDFHASETLLEAGMRLTPARLSLAAAGGWDRAKMAPRPRIAILSTGEELVAAGGVPGPWQIFDSNSPGLTALAASWGATAQRLATTGDNLDAIADAVRHADADLIVTVGGASVGDHDLVKPALERLGLKQSVGSIGIRPGKPTWFGVLEDGRRVLGLPGNPASAFVCAELFLKPLLTAWQGGDPRLSVFSLPLAVPLEATGPREHWMRGEVEQAEDGTLRVRAFPDQESSLIGVFARAEALVRRRAGAPGAGVGELVDVLRLG
jgi:molybdopterin molybdotransferase